MLNTTFAREILHRALLCAALLILLLPARAADWPAYARDTYRANTTDERPAFPLRLAWVYRGAPPSPAWTVAGSHLNRMDFDYAPHPVVAHGLVFIGSSADDAIRAFDARTGALRWSFVTGGPVRFAPQIADGKCYAASDDGMVYCLDALTGAPVWTFRAAPEDERLIGNDRMISRWPLRCGVLVEDGTVYTVAGMWPSEGIYIYALDAATGAVRWCNDTSDIITATYGGTYKPNDGHTGEFSMYGLTPQGSLLTTRTALIVPQANNSPAMYDKRTGRLVNYSHLSDGGAWMTIDAADEERCYRISNPRDASRGRTMVITAGRFVGSSADRRPVHYTIEVLPVTAVLNRWKVGVVANKGTFYVRRGYALALAGDMLIAGEDGAVAAYEAAAMPKSAEPRLDTQPQLMIDLEGKVPPRWRAEVAGQARGLAIAEGRLIVTTDRGHVYCFAPAGDAPATPRVEDYAAGQQHPPATGMAAEVMPRLRDADAEQGFALVLGDAEGRLGAALAAHTGLRVVVAAPEAQAAALRARLAAAAPHYGARLHVQGVERMDRLPFAQFFARAVIVAGEAPGLSGKELYRVLRPCGGVLLFPGVTRATAEALLDQAEPPAAERQTLAGAPAVVRGPLPGARDWNAPGPDRRVKWPLRPLWFGGPDLALVTHYDIGGHPPVAANGRYFITSEETLTAVDAYTGVTLWTRPIPSITPHLRKDGATRLPTDNAPGDRFQRQRERKTELSRALGVDADHVYLTVGAGIFGEQACIEIDARTGTQRRIFGTYTPSAPISLRDASSWPLAAGERQAGALAMRATPAGIVLTLTAAAPRPSARDEWNLFFDFRPPAARYGLYEHGVFQVVVRPPLGAKTPATWRPGRGEAHPRLEVSGTRTDEGATVTVQVPWKEIEALAGARPESFGFAATLNTWDGNPDTAIMQYYLFGDRMAESVNNGWATIHLAGAPPPPPAVVTAPFAARPAAANSAPVTDVGAIDEALRAAERVHPLTGEPGPRIFRSGTGACGAPVYSAQVRFGRTRKESLGIYDFADDSGLRFFGGVAANCGGGDKVINMTAALGVLLFSQSRVHCYCMTPFRTSFALAPAERRLQEDWAIFSERNADAPIRQAHINLVAPGDRRDDAGNLWLTFPGFSGVRRGAKGVVYPLEPGSDFKMRFDAPPIPGTIAIPLQIEGLPKVLGMFRMNADRLKIAGTDRPWLYTSGYRGVQSMTLQLTPQAPLIALPAAQAIAVDGVLDEADWTGDPQATLSFTNTDVRLRFDDRHLYLAARRPPNAPDRQGKPRPWTKTTTGEDAPVWQDDAWEVFLSDAGGARVLHLGVSAGGARYQALASDGKEGERWNAAWTSAAVADDSGFTVEMAIPWQTLAGAGLRKETLAVNLQTNKRDLSTYLPTYPPGNEIKRIADPRAVMTEPLLALGSAGRARCANFAPLGLGAPPPPVASPLTVRLHFVETGEAQPEQRVFDVKLQGETVLKDFDIAGEAGALTALMKEFRHVPAADTLKIEFVPKARVLTAANAPLICAVEVLDEGHPRPADNTP